MVENKSSEITQEMNYLFKIWSDALSLSPMDLENSLSFELAGYLKISKNFIKEHWGNAVGDLKKSWNKINPRTSQEIINFYNTNETQLLESMYWHSQIGHAITDNVRSLQIALSAGGKNYLDYGCGVGSNGILFSKYGFEITLADISSVMLNFAEYRFKKRGLKANFIDLKTSDLPRTHFDFITIIHTLEHVSNPINLFEKVVKSAKIGGILFVTTPFFKDKERPMHIVTEMSITEKFLNFGVVQLPKSTEIVKIYQKVKENG